MGDSLSLQLLSLPLQWEWPMGSPVGKLPSLGKSQKSPHEHKLLGNTPFTFMVPELLQESRTEDQILKQDCSQVLSLLLSLRKSQGF